MAERVLKAQETGTSGKHEASFIHSFIGIQGFQPVIFFLFTGGGGACSVCHLLTVTL